MVEVALHELGGQNCIMLRRLGRLGRTSRR